LSASKTPKEEMKHWGTPKGAISVEKGCAWRKKIKFVGLCFGLVKELVHCSSGKTVGEKTQDMCYTQATWEKTQFCRPVRTNGKNIKEEKGQGLNPGKKNWEARKRERRGFSGSEKN